MSREWQHGDVAMVTAEWKRGETSAGVAYRAGDGWQRLSDSAWVLVGDAVLDARPLVVIDPEDREQVKRLWRAYLSGGEVGIGPVDAMQAALREFADPKPPKPDEPTGLGAVVEDADGERWVRSHPGRSPWTRPHLDGVYSFDQIDAVRVLSDGVQP